MPHAAIRCFVFRKFRDMTHGVVAIPVAIACNEFNESLQHHPVAFLERVKGYFRRPGFYDLEILEGLLKIVDGIAAAYGPAQNSCLFIARNFLAG